MAHWSNAYLTVVGEHAEVARFALRARERPGQLTWVPDIMVTDSDVVVLPRPRGGPGAIFVPDMWIGEGGPLWSERIKSIGSGYSLKRYHFQTRNDDGRKHFQEVSRAYPSLQFVLVSHPGVPDYECRSFLVQNGRTRSYVMPEELMNALLTKHGYDPDLDPDGDEAEENEDKEWEAYWEMMKLAESHWLDGLLRRLARSRRAAPRASAQK